MSRPVKSISSVYSDPR